MNKITIHINNDEVATTKDFDSFEEAADYIANEWDKELFKEELTTEDDVADAFADMDNAINNFVEIWHSYVEDNEEELDDEFIDDVDCGIVNVLDKHDELCNLMDYR